jgi:hypothetical protein
MAAKEDETLTKTAAKKEAQVPPGPGDMTAGAGGGAGGGWPQQPRRDRVT